MEHLTVNISGKVRQVNEGGKSFLVAPLSLIVPSSSVEVALPTLTPEYATGVYCWLNRVNGKRYVGSSARSLLRRMRDHRGSLSKGKSHNRHLQHAWDKYGSRKFAFVILERCAPEDCIPREQYWIDRYQSANKEFGYNLSPTAGNNFGVKHSAEFRLKVSIAGTGRKHTQETKDKIAAANTGHEVSPEVRNKISTTKQSRVYVVTEETRTKIAITSTGRTHTVSPESRELMRIAALNRQPASKETRAKISAASTGRKHSEETKKKIAVANMGHEVSEETRAKIGNSNTGKVQSASARKQNADAQRRRYESKEERIRTGLLTSQAIMADPIKRENRARAGRISHLKRKGLL